MMFFRRGAASLNVSGPFVGSFSAGPDILSLSQFATLAAFITGDMTGHTMRWEQISGPSASIGSPSSQNTGVVLPSIGPEYGFRFYIDKGTVNELYDDMLVRTVPTDFVEGRIRTGRSQTTRFSQPFSLVVLSQSDDVISDLAVRSSLSRQVESSGIYNVLHTDDITQGVLPTAQLVRISLPASARNATFTDQVTGGIRAARASLTIYR